MGHDNIYPSKSFVFVGSLMSARFTKLRVLISSILDAMDYVLLSV